MARFDTRPRNTDAAARTLLNLGVGLMMAGTLAACNATVSAPSAGFSAAPMKPAAQQPTAKPANYKLGKPYEIAGRWFHPKEEPGYDQVGAASWYGNDFHGRQTASGEIYDMNGLTAAHPTLPMPSYARVTNLENNRSVVVRINDRGPFTHGRLIDLSKQTARLLDFKQNGTAQVRVQYLGAASPQGDDSWLTSTVRHDGNPLEPGLVAGGDQAEAPASATAAKEAEADQASLALASRFVAQPQTGIATTFSFLGGGAHGKD